MSEMSIDDIVTLITKQVMDTIAQKKQAAGAADCQGEACVESVRKKVLLVGPKDPLPEGILTGAAIYDIEDFKAERNVLKYDQVIITKLDLTQLSDAANGRQRGKGKAGSNTGTAESKDGKDRASFHDRKACHHDRRDKC